MASVALPLLIALPLLAAIAVLAVPAVWTRRAALGGTALAFLVALWAWNAFSAVRDLRGWFEAPDGPLDRALDAAAVEDPLLRAELRELLREPRPPRVETERLARACHLDVAQRNEAHAREAAPPDPARHAAAERDLRRAEDEVASLAATLARLREERALDLQLAYGRSGERFKLPFTRPWIPPLGVTWSLGADGLALPLALVTTLLALLGLLAAPDSQPAAAPGPLRGGAAARSSRGALAAVLALESLLLLMIFSLDVAVLHVAWALLLVPTYFLVAARGQAPAQAALRILIVGGVGALIALVAAGSMTVSHTGETWSALALHEAARKGEVSLSHEAWFLAALLLAAASRLPTTRAHADALAAVPAWAQGVVLWSIFLGAVYPLMRLGWPLAPHAAMGALVPVAGALGVAALVLGGVLLLRAPSAPALLCGSLVSHGGLLVVGLAASRSYAAAGAILDVVVTGLGVAALAPLLAGIAARTGTSDLRGLSGLGRAAPKLSALAALALALLAGASASTPLVVGGALESGVLPHPLAVLAGLAAVFSAVAHLRLVRAFVGDPGRPDQARVADLGDDEAVASVPLLAAAVVAGLLLPTIALHVVMPAAEWLTGVAWVPPEAGS